MTDDESEKIFVDFEYVYGTEDEEINETVGVSIHMGTESSGKLVLHFERESGNVLYYKKIVNELRSKFAYAIQQHWYWMNDSITFTSFEFMLSINEGK